MSSLLNYVISSCVFAILIGSTSVNAAPQGLLEGHLKIISEKEVELADETPSQTTAANYGDYTLIILSGDRKREIARITANENGNYRAALPPGDYVLDAERRGHGYIRATPQSFTVISNQTVHVDMILDMGIR